LKSEKQSITPQLLGFKLNDSIFLEDFNSLEYYQTVKPKPTKKSHCTRLMDRSFSKEKHNEKELWIITERFDMNLLQWREQLNPVVVSNDMKTSYSWLTDLLNIYQKILTYVNILHTKFIAHGDLKCQNILIKKSKYFKIALTDFGTCSMMKLI
jgi:serine/threonine protein kinase